MTTLLENLPPTFILYIKSRKSAKDIYSGYIHITTSFENGAWKLTPSPFSHDGYSISPGTGHSEYRCAATLKCMDGTVSNRAFMEHYKVVFSPAIRVFSICGTYTPFFSAYKKRNFTIIPAPAPAGADVIAHLPAPAVEHIAGAGTGTGTGAGAGTVAGTGTVAGAVTVKKKPHALIQHQQQAGVFSLPLFVSRQLLQLAQLRKEMCPITAEDYITGQTAVMPCGHLFMQMAIEETFKSEPNCCPACRQKGRPTYC